MSRWTIFIIIICIVLVLIPPKWDPAIMLSEWIQRKSK